MPGASGRTVTFRRPDRPALVLGSTQPAGDFEEAACRRLGIEVARRRTGGGAVLVEAGEVVWADVEIAAGDPLWDDDVGRSFWWLGRAWRDALGDVGVPGAEVHTGAPVTGRWSRRICFAGLGAGEVTVDGRKVLGMAQRRTRQGALFQCAALLVWRPHRLVELLAVPAAQRPAVVAELAAVARGAGTAVDAAALESALVHRLPSA